jgi:hypothetical protein
MGSQIQSSRLSVENKTARRDNPAGGVMNLGQEGYHSIVSVGYKNSYDAKLTANTTAKQSFACPEFPSCSGGRLACECFAASLVPKLPFGNALAPRSSASSRPLTTANE